MGKNLRFKNNDSIRTEGSDALCATPSAMDNVRGEYKELEAAFSELKLKSEKEIAALKKENNDLTKQYEDEIAAMKESKIESEKEMADLMKEIVALKEHIRSL